MKVVALIVTHNRLDKLKITLSKTFAQNFYQVVVVNCGSTDGTPAFLEQLNEPRLLTIQVANLGGAGGFAHGAQYIAENIECDWVVFYDDDAYPDAKLVENILRQDLVECDSFACHVMSKDELLPQMNVAVKVYPNTFPRFLNYIINRDKFFIRENDLNESHQQIEASSFVGFGVRFCVLKKTWQHINSKLFIYYDDLFYTHKLTQLGYNHKFIPILKFTHDVEKNEQVSPWKCYYHAKNLFAMKPLLTLSAFVGFSFMKLLSVSLVGLKSQYPIQSLKLIGLGFWDGITSNHERFGKIDPVSQIIKYYGKK